MLKSGIQIGGYVLSEKIGHGGQAPVWLATEATAARIQHAVKVNLIPWLERSNTEHQEKLSAFDTELNSLKSISSNSNIVSLHTCDQGSVELADDLGEIHQFFYQLLVMEYSPLGDMESPKNLKKFHSLDARSRIKFLHDIAAGVEAIHAQEIIFCDLKPSNILLFQDVNRLSPRITDFGAARQAVLGRSAFGTIGYMAPEVLDGQSPDTKSDIFSLGVTFHQLLTGRYPNGNDPLGARQKDEASFFKSIYKTIEYSKEKLSENDEILRPLLKDMLNVSPRLRPTASEVVRLLNQYQEKVIRTSTLIDRPPSRISLDTFRWLPEVHKRLGENMYFFFFHHLGIDGWERIAKRLQERQIYSFCIHRLLGETDFVLRGWFADSEISKVTEVVGEINGEALADSDRFALKAIDVLPKTVIRSAKASTTDNMDFIDWLKTAVMNWPIQEQEGNLKAAGLISGKILATTGSHIRAFLRIDVTNTHDATHSEHYVKCLEDFFSRQHKVHKRIEQGFWVWRISNNSSFIVEFVLKSFDVYESLAIDLHRNLKEKNLQKRSSVFNSTTLLELGRRGVVESYDGGITDLLPIAKLDHED